MTGSENSVLIVSKPGPLRDGLHALMSTVPRIHAVDESDNAALAIKTLAKRPPTVALVSTYLSDDEVWQMLRQIKTEWPETQCVVLVNNDRELREAEVARADAVLLNGSPAVRLIAIVENLLA